MSKEGKGRNAILRPLEYVRVQKRLTTGTASKHLYERTFGKGSIESGIIQTTRFLDILSAFGGNVAPHAFFVHGDKLIKDFTYGDIAGIIEPKRQNFQKYLNLGRLLTRDANDVQKVAIKRSAAEALMPNKTIENAPFFSENARKHIQAWKEELDAGKSIDIVKRSLALFIKNMEKSVLGVELDEQLREDFSWLFLQGIFSVIVPDLVLNVQTVFTGNSRRAKKVINRIRKIIDARFEQYVTSDGEKKLLIDDYIEHYLLTEIVNEPNASDDEQQEKLKELLSSWKETLKDGGEKQKERLFSDLNDALKKTTREVLATMSASFETTASVFQFCIIMAAQKENKEMYARVVNEVRNYKARVAGKERNYKGEETQDITKLTFSEMLIAFPEIYGLAAATLEKYPPLGLQFRVAGKSGVFMVDGKEYSIKKGDLLFYDLATIANKRPFDQKKHADEIRAHAAARGGGGQGLANKATAHIGFENRGPQNCIGKFTAIEQLMRAIYELADHIPNIELEYPAGVDPTTPHLSATNSAKESVKIRGHRQEQAA